MKKSMRKNGRMAILLVGLFLILSFNLVSSDLVYNTGTQVYDGVNATASNFWNCTFLFSSTLNIGNYLVTYYANLTNGFDFVRLVQSSFSVQNTSITIGVVPDADTTSTINVVGQVSRTNGTDFWDIPNNLFTIKLNNVLVSSDKDVSSNFSDGTSDGNVNMTVGDLRLNLTTTDNVVSYSDDFSTTKYTTDAESYNNVGWSSGHLFDINNMVGDVGNITYRFSSPTEFYNSTVYMSTAGSVIGGGNDTIYYSFDNVSWNLLAETTLTGVSVGGLIPNLQGKNVFYVRFGSDKTAGDNPVSAIEINQTSYGYSSLGQYLSGAIFLPNVTYTTLSWDEVLNGGTVKMQLRESDNGTSWDAWSQNWTSSFSNDITSFSKSYVQYRTWFVAGNSSSTPIVQNVNISYLNASTNSTGGYNYNITIPTNSLGVLPLEISVLQNPSSGIVGSNTTNVAVWAKTSTPYRVVKNYSGSVSNYSVYANFTRTDINTLINGTIRVTISNSTGSWSQQCVGVSHCVASWAVPNDLEHGNYTINISGSNESGYYRNSSASFEDSLEAKTTSGTLYSANKTIGDYSYGNEYQFYWNVSVDNVGGAPMRDISAWAPSFGSAIKNVSEISSCGYLASGENCSVRMLITVQDNAVPGSYYITWRANWTDNDGSVVGGAGYIQYSGMYVNIIGNATMQLSNYSVSKTIQHDRSSGFDFQVQSVGSDTVTNVNLSLISQNITPSSFAIPSNWVAINPSFVSIIPQGQESNVSVGISVPVQTSPGNYTGVINVSSDDAGWKILNLTVIVPINSSWYLVPETNFTNNHSFSLNQIGQVGNWTIVNVGNVNLTMAVSYAHSGADDFTLYPGLFSENNPDGSNPTTVNVTKGKNATFVVKQNGWNAELNDVGIIIGVSNNSGVPLGVSVEDSWSIKEQPPKVTGVWFFLDGNETNIAEQNKNFTLKFRATDDVALNKSGAVFNISWSGGQTQIPAGDLSAVYGQYNLSGANYIVLNYSSNYIPLTADVYHVVASVKDNTGKVSSSGVYNFTSYGSTSVGFVQNSSSASISNVDLTHEGVAYVNYTINNSGLVTAYAPTLSFVKDPSIVINSYTFADLSSGTVESKVIRMNVSALTPAGSYNVSASLKWKNPNGIYSEKTLIFTINVAENKSFSHNPNTISSVVNSGASNSSLLELGNTGNTLLSSMNLNCYTGDLCDNFNVTFNDSNFNIPVNSSKKINITMVAPFGLPAGNYVGAINVSEKNIYKIVDVQVIVPQSKTWGVAPSIINITRGISTFGNVGEVTISNSGNVNMTFNIATTNSSLISANESSVMVPLNSAVNFSINYTTPSVEGYFPAKVVVTNLDSGATPIQSNISVGLTATKLKVEIISPMNSSVLSGVLVGQKILTVANVTYHGVIISDNSTWSAKIGGSECLNVSYFYNPSTLYWNISCYSPNLSDGGTYDLSVTVDNSVYGKRSATEVGAIRYYDFSSPVFNSVQRNNIEKGSYIDLKANISDNVAVDSVVARVQSPNGSIENYSMTSVGGWYSLSSVILDEPGEYLVNYSANDTTGNLATASSWFEVYDRYYWNIKLSSENAHPIANVNISLNRPETAFVLLNGSTDVNGELNLFVNKRFYDLYANISRDRFVVRNVNFTNISQSNISLNFHEMAGTDLPGMVPLFRPFVGIVSNSTGMDSNALDLVFNYSGYPYDYSGALKIIKCLGWNWSLGKCGGTWSIVNSSRDVNTKILSGNTIGVGTYFLAENECGNGLCEVNYGETTSTCSADCKVSGTGTVVSSGSSGGGGGGGGSSSISQTDLNKIEALIRNFLNVGGVKLETSSIYRELFAGDTATLTIRLKNTLNTPTTLSLGADGDIKSFVFFASPKIVLNKTEERTSLIKVVIPRDTKSGSYNGNLVIKSAKQTGKIPVTIRILEPQGKLLDVKIQPLTPSVAPGKILRLQTDIANLGRTNRVDIQFNLELMNLKTGEIITRSEQAFSVKTSLSAVKNLTIPQDIEPGKYMIKATAYYSNVEFKNMHATSLAYIEVQYPFFSRKLFSVPYWLYSLLFLIAGVLAGGFFYYRWLDYKKKRFKIKVDLAKLPQPTAHSGFVGKIAETGIRAFVDLNKLQMHTIIAGATGGGKTVAAQDIVEDALSHKKGVIVFDPTAQWTGFLRKCENDNMLKRYKYFDMKTGEAKAFNGSIKTINDPYELIDLKKYMDLPGEITIFNVSNLSPKEIDIVVASTVEQLFKLKLEEASELKTLIVYDEVHRLLPKFGGSGKGFVQLERGAREFRKWGVGLVLISQVLSDFIGDIKANIGTEIQMGTRYEGDLDRVKMKYGDDALKSVVKAPIGTGLVVNAEYNSGRPYFISFRPSLHSTKRLSNDELKKYETYSNITEDLDYQIMRMKELKADVFDLELELKLAKGKIKSGQFQMADMYLDSLKPKVAEHWTKLGKAPEHLVKRRVSEDEILSGVEKANQERAKYIKKNPEKKASFEQEISELKKQAQKKKEEGKEISSVESMIAGLEERVKNDSDDDLSKDSDAVKEEMDSIKKEMEKI